MKTTTNKKPLGYRTGRNDAQALRTTLIVIKIKCSIVISVCENQLRGKCLALQIRSTVEMSSAFS